MCRMKAIDFLAVGDTTVDEFIFLKDARINCDINNEHCTISMRWGDKVPFESAVLVAGVGSAANAAGGAGPLGPPAGLVADIGIDRDGDDIMAAFANERIDTSFITRHKEVSTNHHYVLSYESERTILVKQNDYLRAWPPAAPVPRTLYYSSTGEVIGTYQDDIVSFAETHPDMLFGEGHD